MDEELALIGKFKDELGGGLQAEGIHDGLGHRGLVLRGERGLANHARRLAFFLTGVNLASEVIGGTFVLATPGSLYRLVFALALALTVGVGLTRVIWVSLA